MRFSLMTLLLISVWVGAGLGVWFRREAWVIERFEPRSEFGGYSMIPMVSEAHSNMPDERRAIGPFGNVEPSSNRAASPFESVVYDRKLGEVIYWFPGVQMSSVTFESRSDDAFKVEAALFETDRDGKVSSIKYGLAHYRRRYPEWWWGHFYRLEVWAFALISIVLLGRGVRALRRGRVAGAGAEACVGKTG